MRDSILPINLLLHHAVLINTHGCENVENAVVHWLKSIHDQCNCDLFPPWCPFLCIGPPEFRLLGLANVTDVEHNAMKSPCIQCLVFIVGRNSDQNFSLSVVQFGSQRPAIRFCEVVWITSGSSVSHVTNIRVR